MLESGIKWSDAVESGIQWSDARIRDKLVCCWSHGYNGMMLESGIWWSGAGVMDIMV